MHSLSKAALLTASALTLASCGSTSPEKAEEKVAEITQVAEKVKAVIPADKFDLSHWKITLPLDANDDGKIDEVSVRKIRRFAHPDFFYLNEDDEMVFTVPNKAKTTSGSSKQRTT